jgi:hypothetical protein
MPFRAALVDQSNQTGIVADRYDSSRLAAFSSKRFRRDRSNDRPSCSKGHLDLDTSSCDVCHNGQRYLQVDAERRMGGLGGMSIRIFDCKSSKLNVHLVDIPRICYE